MKFIEKISRTIDSIISGSMGKKLLFFIVIVVFVFVALFALRTIIFSSSTEGGPDSRFWPMVQTFINYGSGYNQPSDFERIFVLVTNLFGMVLFTGVLIALLSNTVYQRIDNIKNGEVYYNFSNHYIIIGYEHICHGLVQQLAAQGEVVLQTSKDVQEVRLKIYSGIKENLKKNIVIVNGNRVSRDDIEKLNIGKSKQVFLLGEIGEDDHDSRNIECLGIINDFAIAAKKNIRCHVLFYDHLTFAAFQRNEIPGIRDYLDFVPFNFEDMWAQKIFCYNSYNNGEVRYRPLDHEPIGADSSKRVHLIILGMSKMGIALGLQAAQLCHFPNFVTKGIKTRITFIDIEAEREMNLLKNRLRNFFAEIDYSFKDFDHPQLYIPVKDKKTFTDIEFEFISDHFEDDAVQRYLEEAAKDDDSFLTVAITDPDSSTALAVALCLPQAVYDKASVLIRQAYTSAIVSLLSRREKDSNCEYKNLRPYGMLYNCYDIKESDDLLPMMIKYTYDNTTEENTFRDFPVEKIRNNWRDNWQVGDNLSALKASCRYSANSIWVKQRSLDIKEGSVLNSAQINLAARIEHNRWVIEKLLLNFRAPTPEEAEEIANDKEKRKYYKARFIHPDIKAYQVLDMDAKGVDVKLYDINICNAIPFMIKAYREFNSSGV